MSLIEIRQILNVNGYWVWPTSSIPFIVQFGSNALWSYIIT